MQSCSVFTTLVLLALGKYACAECPLEYVDLGTGCYYFIETSQLNWYEAYFQCQVYFNGYLAEIETIQERDYLSAYVKAVIDPNVTSEWWVGASDILQEGEIIWMTYGNPVTVDAWDTAVGEPVNYDDNDCVSMRQIDGKLLLFIWFCDNRSYPNILYRGICETAHI